jgi:hypothetical protein
MSFQIKNSNFVDETGRTLMLRGVNLGGSSKVPVTPDGATFRSEGFFDHHTVSFIGRPFPLAEADEHFSRLRAWGLTFLRFLVTWEAIEHAGPGQYDDDYLDYIYDIIEKANQHGIKLFIDPHQDVWSRFCGGDGAPGWTMEAIGMDLTKVHPTGAAIIHSQHGDPFPQMIWPTNAHKLASATMFALFFAGNDLAPNTRVDGEPVQEYLQRHYFAAIRRLAARIRDLPNVIGFDTMNEPSFGYMGVRNLEDCCGRPRLGDFPTPLQAMQAASGQTVEIGIWGFDLLGNRKKSKRTLNPGKERLWRAGMGCVWRQNGVWDFDSSGNPLLLKPDHFYSVNGHKINVADDYYKPFANRFAQEIRAEMPNALIFVETEPSTPPPHWTEKDESNIVYAPHWYDGITLVFKRYLGFIGADFFAARPVLGHWRVRNSFKAQLGRLKREARVYMPSAPVLVGEIGIPFDLAQKSAFRSGKFHDQAAAMDRSLRAVEDNLLSATIWNYTADNSNLRGDQWNDEDLSIFSRDQQHDPQDIHSGGRALKAVVRPYPIATAGTPLHLHYDIHSRFCEYTFEHDPAVSAPTELFIPNLHYPQGIRVEASGGQWSHDRAAQTLSYRPTTTGGKHSLHIRPV